VRECLRRIAAAEIDFGNYFILLLVRTISQWYSPETGH